MNASMILSFERDINDPLITFCPATLLARGDRNANIIKLTVMDGNAPADLSGNTAVVLFQRPGDSYVVRCPGSVSGNVISVTLLGECYLYAGQYYASLKLDADGFTRTMLRLAGQIESNGNGPIIDPTGTIPGYEDIARIYAELEASLGRSDAATDSANAAAQNANEKAAIADTAAGNANTAAGNANAGAGRANEAAASIEGLTVEASDVSYDRPATATVTDVEGHKHIAFGLRQGVPGPVPKLTFTGETGEPNTDVVVTQNGPPEAPVVNLKIPQGVPGTGNVSTVDGVASDSGGNVPLNAVRYMAQTLEDAQKVQARKNIGVDGQIYPCTAAALEAMSSSDLVGIYNQGYRAIKTENNGTVVLLGLAADGSLEWLGCNQPRKNLFDNPDFSIAQAGYGGMHGVVKYAADRWVASNLSTVSFEEYKLVVVDDGSSTGAVYQVLIFDRPCKITISAGVTVQSAWKITVFDTDSGAEITSSAGSQDQEALLNAEITSDLIGKKISVFFYLFPGAAGGSAQIFKTSVYVGSYTQKTLPPWEAPDYTLEYLMCRRYYKALNEYGRVAFKPIGELVAVFVASDQMRVVPTAETSDFQLFSDGGIWVPVTVASISWMGDCYRIRINIEEGVSDRGVYIVRGLTGLSADL